MMRNSVVLLGKTENMNVGNELRQLKQLFDLLFSDSTVFDKMANITIFSLNIIENFVNILEKVL